MGTQQSKADLDLNTIMNPKTLGIRFFPAVAFAVSCKPTETKPADKHRQGSRSSMNGTCCLAANFRHSTLVGAGDARASGQS
jgi:hypothetical protein